MLEEDLGVRVVVAGPEDDEEPFIELAKGMVVCSVVIWAEGGKESESAVWGSIRCGLFGGRRETSGKRGGDEGKGLRKRKKQKKRKRGDRVWRGGS